MLVALEPNVLAWVEKLLEERCQFTRGGIPDELDEQALRAVQQARRFYADLPAPTAGSGRGLIG